MVIHSFPACRLALKEQCGKAHSEIFLSWCGKKATPKRARNKTLNAFSRQEKKYATKCHTNTLKSMTSHARLLDTYHLLC